MDERDEEMQINANSWHYKFYLISKYFESRRYADSYASKEFVNSRKTIIELIADDLRFSEEMQHNPNICDYAQQLLKGLTLIILNLIVVALAMSIIAALLIHTPIIIAYMICLVLVIITMSVILLTAITGISAGIEWMRRRGADNNGIVGVFKTRFKSLKDRTCAILEIKK